MSGAGRRVPSGGCSRRLFVLGASALFGSAGFAKTVPSLPAGAKWDALQLWYSRPAKEWVEALPVGNGRLGAMAFGRVAQERIQLNEDTLFAGSPYDPNNPDARAALPKVRALIDEGRFEEATKLVDKSFLSLPLTQSP